MRDATGDRIAALAAELVRIPSHNPPGNEDRIARFVADWLRDAGLEPELVPLEPGRSSVVARVVGRERGSIVLCSHLDTVPTDAGSWRIPPLEGRIEDGRLWGLGAADMKGAAATLMHVVASIAEREIEPSKDVVLALTADEEFGYRGAASIAESGKIDDAEVLVIAEPSAGQIYVGQKGELWIEARFAGREAHGSTPDLGINTILPAASFCTRLQDTIESLSEAENRGRATLNVGRFEGGRRVNIVPDRSLIQLDVRTVMPEDLDTVLTIVDRIGGKESEASGAQFECHVISYHPPIIGDPDGSHAIRLRRTHADVTGRAAPIGISPFSTDAVSIVPRLDLPVLIYGPGDIARAHQPDEFIEIDALAEAFEVFRRFVE